MESSRKVIAVVVLVAGVTLTILGITWKHWRSPQMLWTRQQAIEYTDAWRALKVTATSGLQPGDPKNDPKLAAAKARYDAIKSKLDQAIAVDDHSGTVLIAVGVATTAIGAWLLLPKNRWMLSAAEA